MIICGIDEAGKGPVLGSLIICGVTIEKSKIKKLKALKVADSKLLSKKIREELYDKIIRVVDDYELIVLEPKDIDFALNSPVLNLNKLEANHTCELLKKLNPDKAFIDCPDVNPQRYKNILQQATKAELIVEHKAEKYEVVAAASIIAKVIRDRSMHELKEIHKVEVGSGYCSDPVTKKFIDKHWNNEVFSHIIRKSWATYKNKKIEKEQKTLDNF